MHSPLLGPSSWGPFAVVARARGWKVTVPDLTGMVGAESPRWRAMVDAALAAMTGQSPVVVVGHSGGGVFQPGIGVGLGDRLQASVFVDAVLPPQEGAHLTPQGLRELLDAQTVDGVLRPWLDWWPPDAIAEILPDPADRVRIVADMPRLPRAFYDEAVPVSAGWSDGPCGYLRLSEAYDDELNEARARGWPSASMNGTHLGVYIEPEAVLDEVEGLVGLVG